MTEDEIVAFARVRPAAIHTDPAWAATGPFGGLIASGMQTMAAAMRLYVDHYISQVASLASPGLDEVRFPGRCAPTTSSGSASRSTAPALPLQARPRTGAHRRRGAQPGRPAVLTFKAMNFFASRPVA